MPTARKHASPAISHPAELPAAAVAEAINRSQAVIEFELDGTIVAANEIFLTTMGYELDDIVGKHHRMFCPPELLASDEYAAFWRHLAAGSYAAGEYKRIARGGREVWLQATYNPILDDEGRPVMVIKVASDVSAQKLAAAEAAGKLAAIDRSQAVIEFELDGTIITANANFLDAVGYRLDEIRGKHHRIFCDPAHAATEQYRSFWERLGHGEYQSGEYHRRRKDGTDLWLQATYNPILDAEGRPLKVVKFAADVTARKVAGVEMCGRLDAVNRAQAVIEFDLDGHVLDANENFLRAMGYSLREIVGQHHSMFCTSDYVQTQEYRDLWFDLGKGEFVSGQFHRLGKFGRDVHIQATYNPILDLNGEPQKVVKFAYDITDQVVRQQRIESYTCEMSASVQDLAGSIDLISGSSTEASQLANQTEENARQGVRALTAALEAIALMQKSAASIADIVQVMSDIANQTNLLAFNASIEAARAGEHGIGFSIVAGEVRKLAERSSEAAQQIARLIDESGERVAEGAEVSRHAEQAFERIVSGVSRTSETITTIVSATETQVEASRLVNELIHKIADSDVAA